MNWRVSCYQVTPTGGRNGGSYRQLSLIIRLSIQQRLYSISPCCIFIKHCCGRFSCLSVTNTRCAKYPQFRLSTKPELWLFSCVWSGARNQELSVSQRIRPETRTCTDTPATCALENPVLPR